ncbi:MAG TPA: chloride channel protein [Acidimicrobiales bacterium]|nr:chloride channel protein [Acidimicrobiales bacterium]
MSRFLLNFDPRGRSRGTASETEQPATPLRLSLPKNITARVFDWLRGSNPALLPLALVVGAGAGAGAVLFRYLILWVTELATGRADYSNAGRVGSPQFPHLGVYFLLLVPAIGGLLYGPLIDRFAKEARGHGVPEVMYAVSARGGRISPKVAVVKSIASAICIGTGGSVGREGPIVQIGSALGSTLGQRLRVPPARMRLLVACGAAGGISATFNAPIAAVFFALELILGDFASESFGMVVLASVTADVIGRAAFGTHPFLTLPQFHQVAGIEYLFYAVLGLLAAAVGVVFIRVLYGFEDIFDRYWPGPMWLRPATGGVLLGGLLIALPEMYGVGYPILEKSIGGGYSGGFLLLLLVGKLVAVSLTIAIGGSGGVFAPSLFIGAMLGSSYGAGLHAIFPSVSGPAGAYGLIGMGAVFAAASRAPITAVLIIFELTGDYTIVLPLMVAIVLSTIVSRALSKDSIYTLKLSRRGVDLTHRPPGALEGITVGDAMEPVPEPVHEEAALSDLIDRFARDALETLPVVDSAGAYRGIVTAFETEQAADSELDDLTAGQLARSIPTLRTDQSLQDALSVLLSGEQHGVPVVAHQDGRIVGWLTHRDVLKAYSETKH